MGLGNNYDDKHAVTVRWIHDNLPRDLTLDAITWTSDPTPWDGVVTAVYNCFGYAMDSQKFWQPSSIWGDTEGDPRMYWPQDLPQSADQNTWVNQYAVAAESKAGFKRCDDELPWDVANEQMVIIHRGGVFTHAAIQIGPDRWKSKLGVHSDIEHPLDWTLRAFGKGTVFMVRLRRERQLP